MNEYNFDYLNYLTNIPNPINLNNGMNTNYQNFSKDNQSNNGNNTILEPYQGLMKGNLFKNLYDSYKNYKPENINPNNERNALLYQIMQYKFALTDLNLYLDTNPNDQNTLNLYNKYVAIEKQICDKYSSMYGPLTTNSPFMGNNSWAWNNKPWPWEVK